MAQKKESNFVIKYWGIWFPILIAGVTFFSGYKLLEYKVAQLENRAASSLGMEKVREIVRKELLPFSTKFDDHEKKHEQVKQFRIKLYQKQDERILKIERALYRKGNIIMCDLFAKVI